jgi:hypothetical protein
VKRIIFVTLVVLAAPAMASASVPVWRSYRDGDQVRPRVHRLLADVEWDHLHWTRWSGVEATGSGRGADFNGFRWATIGPVRLKLYRAVNCGDGVTIFSRLKIMTWDHGRTSSGTSRYSCRPGPYSNGGGG